jgi:hypothetical protein
MLLPVLATALGSFLGCGDVNVPAPAVATDSPFFPRMPRGPAPAPPEPPSPACPEHTFWTGLSCAHARVTCGGWDGISCDSHRAGLSREERAAAAEYLSIDADARTVCPEDDESKQVYVGHAGEVVQAVAAALGKADAVDTRLAALRELHPTPEWEVATLARAGSVYDCIWSSLRASSPQLFSPKTQVLLQKLQGMVAAAQPQQASLLQQQIQDVRTAVENKWRYPRDRYLDVLAAKLVPRYVRATVLARRHAMEGFGLLRASWRLPVVASVIGDDAMTEMVDAMPDPTAPEGTKGRALHYVPGLLGVVP